jgi:hypothetical protein
MRLSDPRRSFSGDFLLEDLGWAVAIGLVNSGSWTRRGTIYRAPTGPKLVGLES